MSRRSRYKLTVEDESHLTEVASVRFSRTGICCAAVGFVLLSFTVAGVLISLTPLRTLLPGYLKQNQRSATEEGLMRLDSLMTAYEDNKAYIDNFLLITDTDREPGDSAAVVPTSRELTSDSLLTATPEEERFVNQMEERERFNISVLAPLAAEGVMFSPVTSEGIFADGTKSSDESTVLLPTEESIRSAADGTVVALYHTGSEGYSISVQHGRGFLTSYFGVGTPLVGIGDHVNGGQMVALSPEPDSQGRRSFSIRLWHNGLPLVPYEYLGTPKSNVASGLPYEAPRGR